MSSRQHMIEQIAEQIRQLPPPSLSALGPSPKEFGERVLQAILPQVTTVAELKTLPEGAHLACDGEIYYWRTGINMLQQRFHGRYDCDPDNVLAEVGSLTVVWTPEPMEATQ